MPSAGLALRKTISYCIVCKLCYNFKTVSMEQDQSGLIFPKCIRHDPDVMKDKRECQEMLEFKHSGLAGE